MVMPREYHREYCRAWYKARKDKFVEMLGGKCIGCGGTEQLQFDHIDRATKRFAIGKMMRYKQTEVLEELKKCQILCHLCHIEKSRPEISASNLARHAKRRLDAKVAVV